jgi:DNA-binding CsgD family transcriptional regulator
VASVSELQRKRSPIEYLRVLRGSLSKVAVPLPAWVLWGVAVTVSLAWGVTALGIAVALSETTSTWWVVLPFALVPALAVIVSADRVIKVLAATTSQAKSAAAEPSLTPPEIGTHVVPAKGNGRPVLVDDLTDREREVLALLSTGRTNGEIAGELFVAGGTIKSHVNAICRKLGARNRTEAVARARSYGLVKDG